jgi:hypothetical protein
LVWCTSSRSKVHITCDPNARMREKGVKGQPPEGQGGKLERSQSCLDSGYHILSLCLHTHLLYWLLPTTFTAKGSPRENILPLLSSGTLYLPIFYFPPLLDFLTCLQLQPFLSSLQPTMTWFLPPGSKGTPVDFFLFFLN